MCLCHGCGNCEEILLEEGEIEFNSDDKDDEEEWTVVLINVINVLIHYIYNILWKCVLLFCITFFISC